MNDVKAMGSQDTGLIRSRLLLRRAVWLACLMWVVLFGMGPVIAAGPQPPVSDRDTDRQLRRQTEQQRLEQQKAEWELRRQAQQQQLEQQKAELDAQRQLYQQKLQGAQAEREAQRQLFQQKLQDAQAEREAKRQLYQQKLQNAQAERDAQRQLYQQRQQEAEREARRQGNQPRMYDPNVNPGFQGERYPQQQPIPGQPGMPYPNSPPSREYSRGYPQPQQPFSGRPDSPQYPNQQYPAPQYPNQQYPDQPYSDQPYPGGYPPDNTDGQTYGSTETGYPQEQGIPTSQQGGAKGDAMQQIIQGVFGLLGGGSSGSSAPPPPEAPPPSRSGPGRR